jgi:ketosteroid isomerase-like protein
MSRPVSDPENLDLARRYLEAIASGMTGDELADFFLPDVIQEEFPNRFLPQGARRDLPAILDAAARGRAAMSSQSYRILHAVANGDELALEVEWAGTLAVPIGDLPPGGRMRARFAVFLEYRDGKIAAQRNYDCFEPW